MTFWRMAFRVGNQGSSLWEECRRLGVAAISYGPIEAVNFSRYREKFEPKPLWARLKPTQKASLRRVVYEMKAADVIYVKEGPKIVVVSVKWWKSLRASHSAAWSLTRRP